jgi:hypothetical protein
MLSGSAQIRLAVAQFPNTPSSLWWNPAHLWNNSMNDDAALYDCLGQQASFFSRVLKSPEFGS